MRVSDLRAAALAASVFLVLTTTALCQVGSSQASGAILGQVRFESGLAAPAGIVISVENRDSGTLAETVSDTSGRFHFSALPPGEYVATVNSRDYRAASQAVEVQSAASVPVELDVQPINKTANKSLPSASDSKISVAQLSIPEKAGKEFRKGQELLNERHEPAKSIPHFQHALKHYPQFAAAASLLGIAQLQVHDWGEAEKNLQRGLQLDSHSAPAYVALGALFNEEGRYAQAEPVLAQALVLSPSSAMVHYELGRSYWGLGRSAEAEKHARTALGLQPDLPEAHVLLGNLLLREGQLNKALAQFRDYLRLAPDGPMAGPAQQLIAKIEQHQAPLTPASRIDVGGRR